MSFYTLFIYLFCLFNAVSSEGMRRNNISVVTKEKYSPLRLSSEYPLRSVKNDKQQVPNNVRPIRSDGNNYIHRACSSNVVRSLYVLRYFNRTVDKAFSISFKYTQSEKEKRRRHENNYPAVQRQKNIALSSSPLNRIPLPSPRLLSSLFLPSLYLSTLSLVLSIVDQLGGGGPLRTLSRSSQLQQLRYFLSRTIRICCMCGILRIVYADSILLDISTIFFVSIVLRLGSNVGSF
jgi:hypothetical protein